MNIDYEEKLKNFMDSDGKLRQLPRKMKLRKIAYSYLASKFKHGQIYSEKEVNAILNEYHTFGDWALLRREMYDSLYLDRKSDGSQYWLRDKQPDVTE